MHTSGARTPSQILVGARECLSDETWQEPARILLGAQLAHEKIHPARRTASCAHNLQVQGHAVIHSREGARRG